MVPANIDYDPVNNSWNTSYNQLRRTIYNSYIKGIGGVPKPPEPINDPSNIISKEFENVSFGFDNSRIYYPYSVLKHTIYIHCGPDYKIDPIIDSLIYIIDSTRGRMRYYPFRENYCGVNSEITHDITIFLELLNQVKVSSLPVINIILLIIFL